MIESEDILTVVRAIKPITKPEEDIREMLSSRSSIATSISINDHLRLNSYARKYGPDLFYIPPLNPESILMTDLLAIALKKGSTMKSTFDCL